MKDMNHVQSRDVAEHNQNERLAKRLSRLWKVLQLTEGVSLIEDALARAYVFEQDELWEAAIDAYEEALALVDPHRVGFEERYYIADISFRMALCLKRVGRWSEALDCHRVNASIFKESGDLYSKANTYMEIGHIYQMMNLFDPALLYYGEAYYHYRQVAEEASDDITSLTAQHGMANAKESLGNLEFQLNVPAKGVTDLDEARQLYLDLGMPGKAAIISQTLEDIQVKHGGQYA